MRYSSGRGFWPYYLVLGAAASVSYHVVGSLELRTVLAIAVSLTALGALLAGVHIHRPARRLPWYLLAIGQAAALVSWILWEAAIHADGAPPAPGSVEDMFWITNSLAVLGAIGLLMRSRERGRAAILDTGVLACAVALPAWIFVLAPALESSSGWGRPAQATYAFLDVAMLVVVARLALRRAMHAPAGALLLAGVLALLATDTLYTWLSTTGAYKPGVWGDLGWLLSPVLIGAAALHPSMASLYHDARLKRDERLSAPYLVLLGAASLSVPGLIAFDLAGGEGVQSPVVFGLVAALSLLVFGRLAGLIRQGERLRRHLAAQNVHLRERTASIELLREIAEVTDASSTDDVLARAVDAVCRATGLPIGHAYVKERGFPQLAPTQIWHLDDPERWAPFVRLTESLHFVSGHGIPGRVLEGAKPVWVPSAPDDPTLPRAEMSRELGILTAFAFPVLVEGEVAAVLEFFSTDELEPDAALAELGTAVGNQLARVLERREADERLREAEERYRILVEQLPMITYIDVPTGDDADLWRPQYVSPQLERMLGWSADDWLKDAEFFFGRMVHPDDRERIVAVHEEAYGNATGFSEEYRLLHRDGSVRCFADHMVIVCDDDGRPIWSQGYLLDITERKEAEERGRAAEKRFRALVEELPFATYVDVETTTYLSPQIEGMVGYAPEEWLAQPDLFSQVVHPDDRERVVEAIRWATANDEPVSQEYRVIARDGRTVWWRDSAVVVRDEDGRPAYRQGFVLDITEEKRAEAELERLLERERAQNAELRTLDRLKDEFIALVSHELRTPLTSIRGYLELVTDGGAGELSTEQEQFLGVAARNAERLQTLVGDLLFVAQIEAGRLQLETGPVDLERVAAEAVESGRPLADRKGIELTLDVEPLPPLEGDRGRLGQLLDNFVSNALKFTPEGGSVQVRLRREEGSVLIEIEDNGMGIPEAEQERLFERFFRSSSATAQAIQGTGLGLTISKAIAEAHGGSITFTSTEGEGTMFTIAVPLAAKVAMAKVA